MLDRLAEARGAGLHYPGPNGYNCRFPTMDVERLHLRSTALRFLNLIMPFVTTSLPFHNSLLEKQLYTLIASSSKTLFQFI